MNRFRERTIFRITSIFLVMLIVLMIPSFIPFSESSLESFQYYFQFAFILLPLLIYLIVTKQNIIDVIGFKKVKIKYILLAILLTFTILPLTIFISSLSTTIFGEFTAVSDLESSLPNVFVSLFVISVTPAICEEFMFRGVLLDKKKRISIHHLAILIGILFGVFHGNFNQMFYTMPLGMVMAYLTLISGSIFPAMVLHFVNNSWGTVLTAIIPIDTSEEVVEASTSAGSELIILGVFGIIGAAITILIIRKMLHKTTEEICTKSIESMDLKNVVKDYIPAVIALAITIGINLL